MAPLSVALLAAAFVVPRLLPGEEGGFAPAAAAAVTFFAIYAVAILLVILVLVKRRELPKPVLVFGLLPLPIAIVGMAVFWMIVTGG